MRACVRIGSRILGVGGRWWEKCVLYSVRVHVCVRVTPFSHMCVRAYLCALCVGACGPGGGKSRRLRQLPGLSVLPRGIVTGPQTKELRIDRGIPDVPVRHPIRAVLWLEAQGARLGLPGLVRGRRGMWSMLTWHVEHADVARGGCCRGMWRMLTWRVEHADVACGGCWRIGERGGEDLVRPGRRGRVRGDHRGGGGDGQAGAGGGWLPQRRQRS